MAKYGVAIKIDVSNIDKARLFKGQKGTYLDATVFIDPDNQDQYGHNGMITQDVTKDERQSGTKGAILGNCKVFWREDGQQQSQPAQQQAPAQDGTKPQAVASANNFDDFDDDIPF